VPIMGGILFTLSVRSETGATTLPLLIDPVSRIQNYCRQTEANACTECHTKLFGSPPTIEPKRPSPTLVGRK